MIIFPNLRKKKKKREGLIPQLLYVHLWSKLFSEGIPVLVKMLDLYSSFWELEQYEENSSITACTQNESFCPVADRHKTVCKCIVFSSPHYLIQFFSDTSFHSGFLLPKRNFKNPDLQGVQFLFQSVNTLLLLILSSLWEPPALFVF